MNIYKLLENSAIKFPDRISIISEGNRYTYREIFESVEKLSSGLNKLGIKKGDRLSILTPNTPQFVIVYFATLKIGGIVVPINPVLKSEEIVPILKDSGARVVFTEPDLFENIKSGIKGIETLDLGVFTYIDSLMVEDYELETAKIENNEVGAIIYTSGTTGKPKGAMLTHNNIISNVKAYADIMKFNENDIAICVLPLSHIYGQTVLMNGILYSGGTLLLYRKFEVDRIFSDMHTYSASIFMGVPTMFAKIMRDSLKEAVFSKSIRLCNSGGAPIAKELIEGFEKRFSIAMLEGYGLTETSPVVATNRPDGMRKIGSIGVPIPRVEVKIFDESDRELPCYETGELVVRGPNVMLGYFNLPDETETVMRNNWFHTGDLGYIDSDGFIFIVDRKKDVINRGGYKIYPREVEELICRHQKVVEAAVVGIYDEIMGEEIKAFIVPKQGCEVSGKEIINFCKERIAPYKYPRVIEILSELPKSPSGKILKKNLR